MFKKEFSYLKSLMHSIKLQGFNWDLNCDTCIKSDSCIDKNNCIYKLLYTKDTYKILEMRFNDLKHQSGGVGGGSGLGFNLASVKSEMDMDKIDEDYLNSHFRTMISIIMFDDSTEKEINNAIKSFEAELPKLSEVQQKYALDIISDIQNGVLAIDDRKTLKQYICEYMEADLDKMISAEAELFGLDVALLKDIYGSKNERELNEHNRFNRLIETADRQKVISYFSAKENQPCNFFSARVKLDAELKKFIFGKDSDE